MVKESCLYKCTVTHSRKEKVKRFFKYNYFMFYIDLDEIDVISDKTFFFSYNKKNIYSLRDTDYFILDSPGIKKNVSKFLEKQGIDSKNLKVKLLTNVATFGYNFNPVSFYFCFDEKNEPVCVIPEVGNTFHELKLFYLDKSKLTKNRFRDKQTKNFYVSPFLDHDNIFDFNLGIPDEKLSININDFKNGEKIFQANLFGEKIKLTDMNLVKMSMKFPFVTLKVITTIHWQAFILWMKKIRYFAKSENPEKQKGMVLKWKKR